MISLPLVSILLVAHCLTTVTAANFSFTGTPVTVTPFDGKHLSLEYNQSVNIENYKDVKGVTIKFEVSIIIQIIIL